MISILWLGITAGLAAITAGLFHATGGEKSKVFAMVLMYVSGLLIGIAICLPYTR